MLNMSIRYHTHDLSPCQCGSCVIQTIDAPLPLVWSVVRRFNHPQTYKKFIKSCTMCSGDGGINSVREVYTVSGLPATSSIEWLDTLDDESHVMRFSIIGGDHRLVNYRSTMTLHEGDGDGENGKTVAMESYVVDVPAGNTKEETCLFTDTIIRSNLRSLALITEHRASSSD